MNLRKAPSSHRSYILVKVFDNKQCVIECRVVLSSMKKNK